MPEFWDNEGVPNGVAAVFLGETDFNGVHFDGFHKSGILADPAAIKRWRNVSFGENNCAKPDELIRPLP